MSDEQKNGDLPEDPRGEGGEPGSGIVERRNEKIEQQAIRQRWNISEREARAVIARQITIAINPSMDERRSSRAADVVLKAMAQNQADEHKQQPDEVNINLKEGVRILEDDDWYGNRERLNALAAAASGPDSDGPGPVQGGGGRPAVGKNGNGSAGGR